MKTARRKKYEGFTLIETITALAIGLFLVAIIVLVVTPGLGHIRQTKSTERLHANAIYVANTLSHWVKQGENLAVPAPDTLAIRLPDLTVKTITKTGNQITLDGAPLLSDNVLVTSLAFTNMAHSVQVTFDLESAASDQTLSITTTMAQRNSP